MTAKKIPGGIGSIISAENIKNLAGQFGADAVGIAPAGAVDRRDKYIEWLEAGYAGTMHYLSRHRPERFDPRILLPDAESVIVIGLNYFPSEVDRRKQAGPFRVARYAWGEDYHRVIRKILQRLRGALTVLAPGVLGRICVDTAPFMDKYWAERAGLGWQGKHTNLISRDFGNWLLLGSLIITARVDHYDNPGQDHCGRCRRCIEACPTGAIIEPYKMDATRCLSYWTIESKEREIPKNIVSKMDGWIFGCDQCLLACPFNRFEKQSEQTSFRRLEIISRLEKGTMDDVSEAEFDRLFARSPIKRPSLSGINRNIKAARTVGDLSSKK
jgi:epoxyqueuosine reductase